MKLSGEWLLCVSCHEWPRQSFLFLSGLSGCADWTMLNNSHSCWQPEKEFKPWEERLPAVEQSVKTKAGKKEKTLAQQVPGASAPNKAEGMHWFLAKLRWFNTIVSEMWHKNKFLYDDGGVELTRNSGALEGRQPEYIDNAMHWSKMYQTMDASGNVKRVRPEEIGGEKGLLFTDLEAQKVDLPCVFYNEHSSQWMKGGHYFHTVNVSVMTTLLSNFIELKRQHVLCLVILSIKLAFT